MMNKFAKKADNLANGVREHGKYFNTFHIINGYFLDLGLK